MTFIRIACASALAIAALLAGTHVNRASITHVRSVVALAQPNIGGCCEDPD